MQKSYDIYFRYVEGYGCLLPIHLTVEYMLSMQCSYELIVPIHGLKVIFL